MTAENRERNANGDGWQRIAWIVVVLVTILGGIALSCVLAAAAMLMVSLNPGAQQMTAAFLLGLGALCSLLGVVCAIGGAGEPRWRWALPIAGVAYAVAGLLGLAALGGSVIALAAAVLAVLTPWWWHWHR